MNWCTHTQLQLRVRRNDGLTLGVIVTKVTEWDWAVAAVETKTDVKDISSIFDSHSHQVLGMVRGLEPALAKGEKYAKWWLGSRAIHEECPCESIESAAAPPAPEASSKVTRAQR